MGIKLTLKLFAGSLLISLIVIFSTAHTAHADDYKIEDVSQYVEKIMTDSFMSLYSKDISVSFVNPTFKEDNSATTSFSDAFLWAAGTRTHLGEGSIGDLSFVYLNNFDLKENLKFDDELINNIYNQKFNLIKEGGACMKITATNLNTSRKKMWYF